MLGKLMNKKYVLIVGTERDKTSVHVKDKIEQKGYKTLVFDTTKYPKDTLISFSADVITKGFIQIDKQSNKVNLSDIISVYRRWSDGINAPQEEDPLLNEIVYWNIESAVGSFQRCLDCLWVNSVEATELHKYKGYQLKILKQNNIRIPKTLITNDSESLIKFYDDNNKNVIYKPVRGWAHTEKLMDSDLNLQKLELLPKAPIKLQECIDGTDIRVYIIKDNIFAMEIQSNTLDFREDSNAPRIPVKLPLDVEKDCIKVMNLLNLNFTGIDLRRTNDGEYVFFEANPTPVFLYDEQVSGYPITDKLVELLLSEG